ncbi:hypothetical protein TNCV_4897331 [Trichonephila clavipes]|nr:hypothetical protein TNCV_4897331 [Trichonephila clavipes]
MLEVRGCGSPVVKPRPNGTAVSVTNHRTGWVAPLIASPQISLNSCRGVISESDLLSTFEAEILVLEGLSDQDVTQIRRITIKREDVSALDRFNVHRCPTRRVFIGTGLELVTRQATI